MDDWDGFEMERRADGLCKIFFFGMGTGPWSMILFALYTRTRSS